jgi:hypothetical protein
MKIMNKTLAYDSSSEGFDRSSELRGMCKDIIREKTNTDRHRLLSVKIQQIFLLPFKGIIDIL